MRMRCAYLTTMLLAGCAQGDPTPLQGQEEAIDLVWHGLYGEQREPPPIYWRRDICGAPNGKYTPLPWCSFYDNDGVKVSGIHVHSPWHIEVGAPWTSGKISDTSLMHELLHASIGDTDHKRPEWTYLVHEANALLVDHDL